MGYCKAYETQMISTCETIRNILLAALFLALAAFTSLNHEHLVDTLQQEKKKAPDFEVTTIEGNKVSLKQSVKEGKPTVVYFTASWCPLCAKNWAPLSEVYPEYKDRLNFVAIGIDPTDDEKVMANLAKEKSFTFPLTAGNPKVMIDFGVKSQATTVGIDRDGYIVFQKDQTALSADEYRTLFDQLVKQK
jgi:peroxiredoxin